MNDSTQPVAEHLHLDMPAARDETFDIHTCIAERRTRFGRSELDRFRKIRFAIDAFHATATTTTHGLH